MREALLNLSHITTDLKQSVFHQTSRTLFNLSFQLHCWTDNEWDSRELRAVLDRFKHRRVCYLTFFHFFVNLLELELIPLCLDWCAVLVHCGAVCSDELILHIWLLKLPMNPGERIGLKIGSGDCRPSGRFGILMKNRTRWCKILRLSQSTLSWVPYSSWLVGWGGIISLRAGPQEMRPLCPAQEF